LDSVRSLHCFLNPQPFVYPFIVLKDVPICPFVCIKKRVLYVTATRKSRHSLSTQYLSYSVATLTRIDCTHMLTPMHMLHTFSFIQELSVFKCANHTLLILIGGGVLAARPGVYLYKYICVVGGCVCVCVCKLYQTLSLLD